MVPASCPIGSFLAHSRLLLAVYLKPIAQQRMHSPALSEASCRSPLAFGRAAGAVLFVSRRCNLPRETRAQGSVVIFLLIHANSTCLNLTLLVGNCQFLWENKQDQTSSSYLLLFWILIFPTTTGLPRIKSCYVIQLSFIVVAYHWHSVSDMCCRRVPHTQLSLVG